MSSSTMNPNSEKASSPWPRIIFISALIVLAALLRLRKDWFPDNFAPIGAMALFAGACYRDWRIAFLIPLAAMFLSDLWLSFSGSTAVVYGSFCLSVLIGRWLHSRRRIVPILGATLAGAIQFFLITNFASWVEMPDTYPRSLQGVLECYAAGLPFFRGTLAGDFFFVGVLFGTAALAGARFPALREQRLLAAT